MLDACTIKGARGAIFAQITLVVIPALIFSLIESKLVLPAHLKYVRLAQQQGEARNRLEKWQQSFADGFEAAILKYYRPMLKFSLRHSFSVLVLFVGVLILFLSIITSGWTHFTFFPRVPSETARVTLAMPAGTAFDVTNRYVSRIIEAAQQLQ